MSEHFKVGTIVALCNSGFGQRSITKREVYKVRKDGKFYIKFQRGEEVVFSDAMWTPDRFGGPKAQRAGEQGRYSREYIEVWTEKHDQEIAERRAAIAALDRKEELMQLIQNLDMQSEAHRALVEVALAAVQVEEQSCK